MESRWCVLLGGSVLFYLSCGIIPVVVLLISSFITYSFAKELDRNRNRIVFVLSLILALLPLVYTKSIVLFSEAEIESPLSTVSLIGVSFYTFSSVSYLVDVYQRRVEVQNNYGKLLLFLLFFPYVLQGPIARYTHLESQLYTGHEFNADDNMIGLYMILFGLIKKLIIAERIGLIVGTLFSNSSYYSTVYVVLSGVLYAFQLYMDFSGYVNIAEGVARLFSIRLQKNFLSPYFSRNISEFWRNWHATLGQWLRDYIYIPLGGSKKGQVRKCINLLIVFLVSGIWHGTAWTFVAWGIYHGILSVIHAIVGPKKKLSYKKLGIREESVVLSGLQMLHTTILVCIGWIFFRAANLSQAVSMIIGLFKFQFVGSNALRVLCRVSTLTEYEGKIMLPFILLVFFLEWLTFRKKVNVGLIAKIPVGCQLLGTVVMIICLICFSVQGGGAFMYEVF